MKVKKGFSPEQYGRTLAQQNNKAAAQAAQRTNARAGEGVMKGRDEVQLSLGRRIQELLNPEGLKAERADRVQSIRDQIAAGTYNVPSEEIASAFGHEVVFDILQAKQLLAENE